MADYCSQSNLRNTVPGHFATVPRQMGSALTGNQDMWSVGHHQGDETYKKIDLATLNRGVGNYEAYMRTSTNTAPVLPQQRNEDNIQNLNVIPASDGPDKKAVVTLIRVKKSVLVIGIFLLICFLLSLAALGLGVLNFTDVLAPAISAQAGVQSSVDERIKDIVDRVSNIKESFSQLRERLASIEENVTSEVDAVSEHTSTALAAESARINSRLTSLSTRTNVAATFLRNVSSRIDTRVNLYQGCYKDSVSCRVMQHATNTHWYSCNTPYLLFNVTGYSTLSTQCHRDPETRYIDMAYIELSGSNIRCHCFVVGLTSSGAHGTFTYAPSGDCHLVITRCPTSQNIFP